VDLDGDGHTDILSGSWPGELFLFKGLADRTFAAPEMLKDKDGEIINIGGGVRDHPDGEGILIAGTTQWETADGVRYVTYHGKRYESTEERPIATTGMASAAHAADWDGDGDLDLLVGNFYGGVYLIPNEGTRTSRAFGKERQLETDSHRPVKVNGKAAPIAADWDGDGDLDLLVGADDGSISLYRNSGSTQLPQLAAPVQLVPPGERGTGSRAPKDPRRGTRSKICVADWNGDGRLDLLVGDYAHQKPDRPEPTPDERARYDRIRKELQPIQERSGELFRKLHMPPRIRDKDERERLSKEWQELSQRSQALRSQLPREYEPHGWVWLFLRKE